MHCRVLDNVSAVQHADQRVLLYSNATFVEVVRYVFIAMVQANGFLLYCHASVVNYC